MKKLLFAFALLVAATLVSCTKETAQDEPAVNTPAVSGTLMVQATKAPVTKALELKNGTFLNAYWAEGETVKVYKWGSENLLGTLSPTAFGSESAKLEGTVDISGLAVGDYLELVYSGSGDLSYAGQDGTLETISDKYDFAVTSVKVEKIEDSCATTTYADFDNIQAIIKFKLTDKDGAPVFAKSLTINGNIVSGLECLGGSFNVESGPLVIKNADAPDEYYVSLNPESNYSTTYYLCALGNNGKYYECRKENVNFEAGRYYEGTVKMEQVRYTVVGCSGPYGTSGDDPLFGKTWDYSQSQNDMTLENEIFTKSYPGITKGSIIYLKVVRNRDWDTCWPAGDNMIVTAWDNGTLVVNFNPYNGELEAYMDYGEQTPDYVPVYTVAGTPAYMFGDEWKIITPENDMILQSDEHTYSITYTGVYPGDVRFRVVADRSWDTWLYPADYDDPYYVSIPSYGSLTINFDCYNGNITTSFVPTEAADADYYVAGSFSGWSASADYLMTKQTDGTYTLEIPFAAASSDVEFKVLLNGSWSTSWPANNYVVSVPEAGILTIIFDPTTTQITTSFQAQAFNIHYTIAGATNNTGAGEDDIIFGKAWDPTLTDNDMDPYEGNIFAKYYTISAAAQIAFKVVKDYSWDKCWPADNYIADLLGPGTLVIAFSPELERVIHQMQYSEDVYSLTGDICDWLFPVDMVMTKQADGTYTKSITVSEGGSYDFKVVKNGNWSYGSWPEGYDANYVVEVSGPCTITFVFDPATGTITHTIG